MRTVRRKLPLATARCCAMARAAALRSLLGALALTTATSSWCARVATLLAARCSSAVRCHLAAQSRAPAQTRVCAWRCRRRRAMSAVRAVRAVPASLRRVNSLRVAVLPTWQRILALATSRRHHRRHHRRHRHRHQRRCAIRLPAGRMLVPHSTFGVTSCQGINTTATHTTQSVRTPAPYDSV